MKTKLFNFLYLSLLVFMLSCGSAKEKDDTITDKYSNEEKQAIEYVENVAAENNKSVISCTAITSQYPYYLSDRYAKVFISTAIGKFLTDTKMSADDEMALISQFKQISDDLKKSQAKEKDKYIIVMAEFGSNDGKTEISKYLYFFRLPFNFEEGKLPTKAGKVTKELQQQVSLIALLDNDISLQDIKQSNKIDNEVLKKIKDPVMKFILD